MDSEFPLQELQPDPWLVNQDPASCAGKEKIKIKKENNNKVKIKLDKGTNRYVRKKIKIKI